MNAMRNREETPATRRAGRFVVLPLAGLLGLLPILL